MLPRLSTVLCRLARNQRGVTAVEYTLLVAVAAVAAMNNVGQTIQSVLSTATSAMI